MAKRDKLQTMAGLFLLCAALAGCNDGEEARAAVAVGGDAGRGRELLVQYGCAGCHTIKGVRSERGLVGPPLVGLRQRAFIGGSLPNTPDNMERWIMHPHQFNPNSAMPDLGVTPAQARDMTAYLYNH